MNFDYSPLPGVILNSDIISEGGLLKFERTKPGSPEPQRGVPQVVVWARNTEEETNPAEVAEIL